MYAQCRILQHQHTGMGTHVGIDFICRIRCYWPCCGLYLAITFDHSGDKDSKAPPRAGLWLDRFTFGNRRRNRKLAIRRGFAIGYFGFCGNPGPGIPGDPQQRTRCVTCHASIIRRKFSLAASAYYSRNLFLPAAFPHGFPAPGQCHLTLHELGSTMRIV